jgi:Holliday junction DNA helicase RuvA
MIASIQGIVSAKPKDALIIVTHGIGYEIFVTRTTYHRTQVNDELLLHTTLVVREDSMTLYGFTTPEEKDIFNIVTSVSGVGAKLGLAILGTMTTDNLRNAIASEKHELLTRVPGIGKKTAQKIVFELKDKLMSRDTIPIDGFDENDINSDVLDTLIVLGFSVVEAQTAVQSLPPDAPEEIEERVRMALQILG